MPSYAAPVGPDPDRDPHRQLATWEEAQAVEQVYASIDTLAAAFHAQMAALTATPAFPTWRLENPTYKPRLSGFLATANRPASHHCPSGYGSYALLHLIPPASGHSTPPGAIGRTWPVRVICDDGRRHGETF